MLSPTILKQYQTNKLKSYLMPGELKTYKCYIYKIMNSKFSMEMILKTSCKMNKMQLQKET
jgi:hypothetical protein